MIETYEIYVDNSYEVRQGIRDIVQDYCVHNGYDHRSVGYVSTWVMYSFVTCDSNDSFNSGPCHDMRTYDVDTTSDIETMLNVVGQVMRDHYIMYGSRTNRNNPDYAIDCVKRAIGNAMRKKEPK